MKVDLVAILQGLWGENKDVLVVGVWVDGDTFGIRCFYFFQCRYVFIFCKGFGI